MPLRIVNNTQSWWHVRDICRKLNVLHRGRGSHRKSVFEICRHEFVDYGEGEDLVEVNASLVGRLIRATDGISAVWAVELDHEWPVGDLVGHTAADELRLDVSLVAREAALAEDMAAAWEHLGQMLAPVEDLPAYRADTGLNGVVDLV